MYHKPRTWALHKLHFNFKISTDSEFLRHRKMTAKIVNKSQSCPLKKCYTKNFNRFIHLKTKGYHESLREKEQYTVYFTHL